VQPWHVPVKRRPVLREDDAAERWLTAGELPAAALPAPVKKLLEGLAGAGMI
jgi:A/G-specific adenine glycosylase